MQNFYLFLWVIGLIKLGLYTDSYINIINTKDFSTIGEIKNSKLVFMVPCAFWNKIKMTTAISSEAQSKLSIKCAVVKKERKN